MKQIKITLIAFFLLIVAFHAHSQTATVTGKDITLVGLDGEEITIDTLGMTVPFSYIQEIISGGEKSSNCVSTTETPRGLPTRYLIGLLIILALFVIWFILLGISKLFKWKWFFYRDIGIVALYILDLSLLCYVICILLNANSPIALNSTQAAIVPPLIFGMLTYLIKTVHKIISSDTHQQQSA